MVSVEKWGKGAGSKGQIKIASAQSALENVSGPAEGPGLRRNENPESLEPAAIKAAPVGDRPLLSTVEKIVIKGKEERSPENKGEVRTREDLEAFSIVADLKQAFRRVGRQIVGREELLNQTMYALLTREHVLIYSRAGMAKSLYAGLVFGQFKDAHTFSTQLTKGTSEEGLVGAINIDELKKGNIIHNVKGSIVDARLAFLDEIFDANDVALRSLLGILNERLFRKGKQSVEAVLHTAIATSNYIRASEVTEAVIDRFAFRSVLAPEKDPYEMLRIDLAYERNGGHPALPKPEELIPIEHLDYLADIVEGRVPGMEIQAPPHVLFMKNAVIAEYVRLVSEARKARNKPELYVSPRTIAKARDILNASALLRGRMELSVEDLADMKYMITTIGDPEGQEKFFDQAVRTVTESIKPADRKTADFLMKAHDMAEQVLAKIERGENFEPSFLQKVKIFFGLASLGSLTFKDLKRVIQQVETEHPLVQELKTGIMERLSREEEHINQGSEAPLL